MSVFYFNLNCDKIYIIYMKGDPIMEGENKEMNEFVNEESKKYETAINSIPAEYKPISTWGYFGYEVLFAIPVIGFIIMLIFALGGTKNINLKNLARSKFCIIVVGLAIIGVGFLIGGAQYMIEAISKMQFPK